MKISQLTPLTVVRRDIQLPLSVAGQNASMTIGQILDAAGVAVLPFDSFFDSLTPSAVVTGSSSAPGLGVTGDIIFDPAFKRFCYKVRNLSAPGTQDNFTLYQKWAGSEQYTDSEGNIRTDCLFVSAEGRLYRFNGTTLISVGITAAQAEQLALNTPIEVSSEEAMQQMINANQTVEGQIYYVVED